MELVEPQTPTGLPLKSASLELPIIHMFWHGAELSRVERMCMASFVAWGHHVQLHVYDDLKRVPIGLSLVDANRVLPEKYLFRHAKTNSIAMFADWFRYRVLYAQGGIWSDTDVVCLEPLRYTHPEIYAWQDEEQINNAVLGLPEGHPLALWMANCCESPNKVLPYDDGRSKRRKWRRRFLEFNRRGNVKWGEFGPMGFTAAARYLGYTDKALPTRHFYPVPYMQWHRIFDGADENVGALLADSKALHLWNEMMRRQPGFDKNARFPAESLFEKLCSRYLKDDN